MHSTRQHPRQVNRHRKGKRNETHPHSPTRMILPDIFHFALATLHFALLSQTFQKTNQMSFQIDCPNCGCRPVWEYHYGGTPRKRPDGSATERQWAEYLYNRPNISGEQTEWWYHRSACKLWF